MEGPADLAVEIVSPESADRDYKKKRRQYERFGIPEYWIVDEAARQVTMLRLDRRGKYREVAARKGRLESRVQPGFWRRMKPSYRAASAITLLVALWLGSGILSGGAAKHADDTDTKANAIPSVQVQRLAAIPRDAVVCDEWAAALAPPAH